MAELAARYHAHEVWLVGSLARRDFRRDSDIDLMTVGQTEKQAWDLMSAAAELAGTRVDVLRAETLSPEWRAYHEQFGERLR